MTPSTHAASTHPRRERVLRLHLPALPHHHQIERRLHAMEAEVLGRCATHGFRLRALPWRDQIERRIKALENKILGRRATVRDLPGTIDRHAIDAMARWIFAEMKAARAS